MRDNQCLGQRASLSHPDTEAFSLFPEPWFVFVCGLVVVWGDPWGDQVVGGVSSACVVCPGLHRVAPAFDPPSASGCSERRCDSEGPSAWRGCSPLRRRLCQTSLATNCGCRGRLSPAWLHSVSSHSLATGAPVCRVSLSLIFSVCLHVGPFSTPAHLHEAAADMSFIWQDRGRDRPSSTRIPRHLGQIPGLPRERLRKCK